MLKFITAGESHGPALSAIIEGLPAGLKIDQPAINHQLVRRQSGFGRSHRMKIEKDEVRILSGINSRRITTGAPLSLYIANRDWENWRGRKTEPQRVPRPGHADLAGAIKYRLDDVRDILERASARETAIRTAVGAVCRQFLGNFGICFHGHVRQIGQVKAKASVEEILKNYSMVERSEVRAYENSAEMIRSIKHAIDAKDSVGGIIEIIITGCPVGLGSHVSWDRKLDACLGRALLSIQGVKGVEFGEGFHSADLPGSEAHDEIFYSAKKGYYRKTNHAGGIEGGMSNGNLIVVRAAMKPIPTLMKPLMSVDMASKKTVRTFKERSDVCAVPALSVIAENVCAFEIAREFLVKYGGDSMDEIHARFK